LLARAHERLDELPDDLAAVVRSRVGYPVSRQDVLARPAVTGRWLVLAVRDLTDAAVPGRRAWLREAVSGQWAMLLTFATPQGAWQDPDAARLRPGTEVLADLHYYPGEPALRAVLGQRRDGDPGDGRVRGAAGDGGVRAGDGGVRGAAGDGGVRGARADGIGAMLTQWASALEADPWLTTWPVLLSGTPVAAAGEPGDGEPGTRGRDGGEVRWRLADQAGNALPLAARESLWTLLAVSGGQPVTVAGEWHPDGLVALTTWHGEEVVPL
jgi:hypothetical protein